MTTYGMQDMKNDLFSAIKSRPSKYTKRPLGNSSNIALWTDREVALLWNGVVTAWKLFFLDEFPRLATFARVVIAFGVHLSTGNFKLNVTPTIDMTSWRGQGFMQIAPASVVAEYAAYGKPICCAVHGEYDSVMLDPATVATMDAADPGLGVVLWAWYVKNCVVTGMSMKEYANRVWWNIPEGLVTRVFGNCLLTWVAGPHNDFLAGGERAFNDVYKRVLDYYTQSGFGNKFEFDSLMRLPLRSGVAFLGIK